MKNSSVLLLTPFPKLLTKIEALHTSQPKFHDPVGNHQMGPRRRCPPLPAAANFSEITHLHRPLRRRNIYKHYFSMGVYVTTNIESI